MSKKIDLNLILKNDCVIEASTESPRKSEPDFSSRTFFSRCEVRA